jgi:tetratricopeptide (TPR) repeat protein
MTVGSPNQAALGNDVFISYASPNAAVANSIVENLEGHGFKCWTCLAGDCRHLEARINLGRLLHLEGKLREAENIYRGAEEPSAILLFNLGILLEDLKRELEAVEAYQQAIIHDPGMADAHFNLSALHERLGHAQAAFRHLLA